MYILAADPGKTGAIVHVQHKPNAPPIFQVWNMPASPAALWDLFDYELDVDQVGFGFIEMVGQFNPTDPAALKRMTANLKLRRCLGQLEMAFIAAGATVQKVVTPKTWQSWLYPGLPEGQAASTERKKLIHGAVMQRISKAQYGNFTKITQKAADAFAIALYGMHHCPEWR